MAIRQGSRIALELPGMDTFFIWATLLKSLKSAFKNSPPQMSHPARNLSHRKHTDHLSLDPVFSHGAHDVGMVMLDPDFGNVGSRESILRERYSG